MEFGRLAENPWSVSFPAVAIHHDRHTSGRVHHCLTMCTASLGHMDTSKVPRSLHHARWPVTNLGLVPKPNLPFKSQRNPILNLSTIFASHHPKAPPIYRSWIPQIRSLSELERSTNSEMSRSHVGTLLAEFPNWRGEAKEDASRLCTEGDGGGCKSSSS